MANPFVRTMRSFEADSYYSSLIGLVVSMVLLIMWLMWFFSAPISVYKTSLYAIITSQEAVKTDFPSGLFGIVHRMETKRGRYIQAEFPIEAQGSIKRGQKAAFMIMDKKNNQKKLPAIVTKVVSHINENKIKVELMAFMDKKMFQDIKSGTTGKVFIETSHETPASMVMNMSGLFMN
ncbi:MAG: hypothetical protein HQK77_21230 [Desulfobacterales bacterium]|nr:hypothetical protein [Desulfobacterales bacterium]